MAASVGVVTLTHHPSRRHDHPGHSVGPVLRVCDDLATALCVAGEGMLATIGSLVGYEHSSSDSTGRVGGRQVRADGVLITTSPLRVENVWSTCSKSCGVRSFTK